jgi:hypothetical protein
VAAIPGAASVEQLESNVAAADIDLADDEYRALRLAAAGFRPVRGPGFMARQVRALRHPADAAWTSGRTR